MRILVVDDYGPFANTLRLLLTPDHDVSVLTSGAEALALLRGGAEFDVVLCDLGMPGVSGMELYRRLAAERPGFERRLAFMTGGAHGAEALGFLAGVPNERIEKPFDGAGLRALLARVAS